MIVALGAAVPYIMFATLDLFKKLSLAFAALFLLDLSRSVNKLVYIFRKLKKVII